MTAQRRGRQRKAASSRPRRGGKPKAQPRAKSQTNLFDLLKQDHEKVKDLFEQIEEDGEMELEDRGDIFAQIEEELEMHIEGEEKFFYPALKENEETHEKVLESYEEHNVTKTVLNEFGNVPQDDERWRAKMKVLKDLVEHHIREEEREVFKLARKALPKEQLQRIHDQIQQQKGQVFGG